MLGGIAGLSLDNTEHQGVQLLHPEECEASASSAFNVASIALIRAVGQYDRAWNMWSSEAMSGSRF